VLANGVPAAGALDPGGAVSEWLSCGSIIGAVSRRRAGAAGAAVRVLGRFVSPRCACGFPHPRSEERGTEEEGQHG